jgi:hypothetical protein
MRLQSYTLDRTRNLLHLYFAEAYHIVYLNKYTGNIYKREKNHAILRHVVDHKGLYIGALNDGTHIFIHSHIDARCAELVTREEFAQGIKVELDTTKNCTNHPYDMIESALQQVLSGEPYNLKSNSCQTLVNQACTNQRKNDDTARVVVGVIGVAVLVAVIDSFFND